jgi:hypothetical protein
MYMIVFMEDIQFDIEQEQVRSNSLNERSSGLIGLVQRWGFAKTDQQAQYILLGVVCVVFLITLSIVIFPGAKKNNSTQLSPSSETTIPGP